MRWIPNMCSDNTENKTLNKNKLMSEKSHQKILNWLWMSYLQHYDLIKEKNVRLAVNKTGTDFNRLNLNIKTK